MPASGHSGGHITARFSAVMTGFGAVLAMVVLMLTALIAALLADFSTQLAELASRLTLQGHKLCRQTADIGALHIQPDTVPHHLKILFLQAGCRAVIAGRRAEITGLNALLNVVVHVASLMSVLGCLLKPGKDRELCK